MSNKYKQLDYEDLKPLREKLHKAQNGICPILGIPVPLENTVVDHQHKKTDTPIGENGAGLIRGVIQRQANVIEGKITNAYKRYALDKTGVPLPVFLRNLANYLEQENLPLIHPTEKPKPKKFGKREFNKLNKLYMEKYPKRKPLVFPARKDKPNYKPTLSEKWLKLFKEFNIEV